MPRRAAAPPDPWTAALHAADSGSHVLGTGLVIDERQILTSAHVLRTEHGPREEVWVAFPKSAASYGERRAASCRIADRGHDLDLALLELHEPPPATVLPAPLRCVPPAELCQHEWWAFGFPPAHQEAGNEARGRVGAALGYGHLRLDTDRSSPLQPGFSGSGVWSPAYRAVVGLVVAAAAGGPEQGNGRAVSLHRAASELPALRLHELSHWSVEAADDPALAVWGWHRRINPQLGSRWQPRDPTGADGFFRGRRRALEEVITWLRQTTAQRRMLVVTGSAGVGKSTLLGRVIATADPHLRAEVPDDDAPWAPLRSVSCAVHAGGKTAPEIAIEIARAASVALPERPEQLVPALRQRLATTSAQPFTLIVDGLDQMVAPEQARQLIHSVLLPLAAATDPAVQVIIGARPADQAGELLTGFGDAAAVLDLDDPGYLSDVELAGYTSETLRRAGAGRPDNPYPDRDTADPVARRIAELADGNYLIAELTARTHGRFDPAPIEPAKVTFAPTVAGVLESYLAGLEPVGTTPARLVLTVLAYAEAPGLPLPLWHAGVAALGGSATEPELADFAQRTSVSDLVTTNRGPTVRAYRLAHQALAEALRCGREATGHRTRDESQLLSAWLRPGRGTGWSATYDYLLRELPAHASRADEVDRLLHDPGYLLHADLARLGRVAHQARSDLGQARARLILRTPLANPADAATRAAMFSVCEQLDQQASTIAVGPRAPYRAGWAHTRPRTERTAIEGHPTGVQAVATVPYPERTLLASAGAEGTVRLWDAGTGQPERVLAGHTDLIRTLCVIHGGQRPLLASAGDDHTVRLWDPLTGRCQRVLAGHSDWVRALCPIRAGSRWLLASGGDDATVRLWDPGTGALIRQLPHHGWVTALASVTVAGRPLLATAGYDQPVSLWDPTDGALVRTLPGELGWITGLAPVERDGRHLLAGVGYDPVVRMWDPATGQADTTANVPAGPVTAVCPITVRGRRLLALASEARAVLVWDPATGQFGAELAGHTDGVRDLCAVEIGDRALLASAGDDGTVRLWDPATGTPQRVLDDAGPITVLATAATGETTVVAAASRDGTVSGHQLATGERHDWLADHPGAVTSLSTLPTDDGTMIALGGENGTIWLRSPAGGRCRALPDPDQPASPVTGLCSVQAPDTHWLAAAADQQVRLWDIQTGQVVRVLNQPCRVTAICAVPTPGGEQQLATADEDGVVRLWDPTTGERLHTLRGHHAAATALCAVVAGGRQLLASASEDRGILVWDPETGDRVATLPGHTGRVTDLCPVEIGEGAQLLASTSEDRTVRLWEPANGACRQQIPVYHPALACRFADGTLVLGLAAGILAIELRSALL